ncbi:sigma-70 family RNA polymerase sigma factor [Pedosphaera parvula]|uniref:RNA polymerase, sigma-24 subunit, ECF subfamily n=1 Tax=Pedosphaera parvula (strain Ellin514) TaxID=320771 RepID=B9XG09_PEDPL|nr:sigma-70 family RNA polymerase sigma factor [Pedosphaera parvula]EEF61171.1 RNA polymerase, sigma-24 subunit, ECF subfamily [Pedosphaera parvula Ellin514]
MTDSQRLLAEYAQTGSEPAFQELVSRYINFVYSTAVRLVGGDAHLAEDVTQMVFIGLASKGRTFSTDVMLGGWLHQHTYHVATKAVRAERRRQSREREAVEMNELQGDTGANLRQVAPMLEEAITQLGSEDRMAILLRFFEQRDFRSVGEALGSNENAARMRVNRALEKLHALLKHRGVTLTITALGVVLSAKVVHAAPAGLAAKISSIAPATTAAGTGTTLTSLKLMAKTKLKLGLATLVVAGVATTMVMQHHSQAKLREENESFREQMAQLKADNESLSSLAAQAKKPASLPGDQFKELLRLRGEVGMLRRQTNELGRFREENRRLLSQVVAQSEPTNQVSAEDQFTLRKTHVVDAMTTVLNAIKDYAANHNGQVPVSLDQLTASGDLGTSNFVGNVGLEDFELVNDGAVDQQGHKVILRIRVPIPGPGGPSVMVLGRIGDSGAITELHNVSPQ